MPTVLRLRTSAPGLSTEPSGLQHTCLIFPGVTVSPHILAKRGGYHNFYWCSYFDALCWKCPNLNCYITRIQPRCEVKQGYSASQHRLDHFPSFPDPPHASAVALPWPLSLNLLLNIDKHVALDLAWENLHSGCISGARAVKKGKERMLQDGKLDSHPTSLERLPTKQWTRLCTRTLLGWGTQGGDGLLAGPTQPSQAQCGSSPFL